MAIAIKQPHERITPDVLEAFEGAIGHKLPEDYRQFLLAFNGGRPESNEFSIPGQNNSAGVNLFYGLLKSREWGDLSFQRTALVDRVPTDVLPIGEASSGNAICLSLQRDTSGQIFFWDHEIEAEEGEPATFSNLFKIGDSFDGFFSGLKPFDPAQVQLKPGQVKKAWINPDFLKEQKQKGNSAD